MLGQRSEELYILSFTFLAEAFSTTKNVELRGLTDLKHIQS